MVTIFRGNLAHMLCDDFKGDPECQTNVVQDTRGESEIGGIERFMREISKPTGPGTPEFSRGIFPSDNVDNFLVEDTEHKHRTTHFILLYKLKFNSYWLHKNAISV